MPDPSTLLLITELAARLLPHAADRAGLAGPVDVRLVLTGPGGGSWDMTVGRGASVPSAVLIVTGAVGFCRPAANRVTPAGLNLHVTGDPACAAGVLAAASQHARPGLAVPRRVPG